MSGTHSLNQTEKTANKCILQQKKNNTNEDIEKVLFNNFKNTAKIRLLHLQDLGNKNKLIQNS